MSGRNVAAVIFDWGGTLTPWHTVDLVAQWRAYAEVMRPANADELAAALHDQELLAWQRAERQQASGTLDDLFRAAGVEPGGERHDRALARYHEVWVPHTLIDPDAPNVLAALRERGVKVGVLSNTLWPREQHEKVFARDGVLDLIDGAVYSSEIQWTKPHPEAFRAALRAVGDVEPARAVFVGDRLFDDVSGAQAVGMRAVHVPHSAVPSYDVLPDATVQRLSDIVPLVDTWNGAKLQDRP